VLLSGETGTGKEMIATAIHENSPSAGRAMVRVNCGAIPAALVESEMFGREKGAYTGALSRQIGRFEIADGYSIFLDEITELPMDVQLKLLVRAFRFALPVFTVAAVALAWTSPSFVAITFSAIAFGSVIAISSIASWAFRRIPRESIFAGIETGAAGTLFCLFAYPFTERMVLRSIAFTAVGLVAGACYPLLAQAFRGKSASAAEEP
jgi:hypothetical protein